MPKKIKPNAARRNQAYGALRFHSVRAGLDPDRGTMQDAMTRLLTNLRLLAAQNGVDFPAVCVSSKQLATALTARPDTGKNVRKIRDAEIDAFTRHNPVSVTGYPGAASAAACVAGIPDDDHCNDDEE